MDRWREREAEEKEAMLERGERGERESSSCGGKFPGRCVCGMWC